MKPFKEKPMVKRILAAAVKLYGLHGADAVGMRMLAAEVGVQPNTITHHFGSKMNLRRLTLAHALETGVPMAEVLARHTPHPTDDPQSRADQLAAVVMDLAEAVTSPSFEPYARMIAYGILGTDIEQKKTLLDAFNKIEIGFMEFMGAVGIELDEMQTRFFTYYLWSQVLHLSASQDFMRLDLGTDELPAEFMDAFVKQIARVCCLTIGLPEPNIPAR